MPVAQPPRRPARSPVMYGQPVFTDIPDDEERRRLKGESDPNVTRIEIYRGYVVKKFKPYNHWLVVCATDHSKTPEPLCGAFTDLVETKKAINAFLETETGK